MPEISVASRTQNGASAASLPLIVQANWASRDVVLAAGAAVNVTTWTADVVVAAGALSGLAGWNMSSRASFQTLNRRVALTRKAYSVPGASDGRRRPR